jgi:hypothetical protein
MVGLLKEVTYSGLSFSINQSALNLSGLIPVEYVSIGDSAVYLPSLATEL